MRRRETALGEVFRNIETARIDLGAHLFRNETFQYGYRVCALRKLLAEFRTTLSVIINDEVNLRAYRRESTRIRITRKGKQQGKDHSRRAQRIGALIK